MTDAMPLQVQLTPEQNVLVGIIRADRACDEAVRKLVGPSIDWTALLHTAQLHGVLPLLYNRLKALCPELVPAPEMAHLQDAYKVNAFRNLRMAAELVSVLELLKANGVTALPFKGPVLAAQAYADLTLRQFVDLDILVQRQDLQKTAELLQAQGYRRAEAFTPAQERSHLKWTNEISFLPQRGIAGLDVHWRFAADFSMVRLSTEGLFAGNETLRLEGHEVPVLPPDSMLLFLCLHGTFHLWTRLINICDVARFVEAHPSLDWQKLLRAAEAAGLRRMLLWGMGLAQDVAGTRLPPEIVAALDRDRAVHRLRRHVRAQLFVRESLEPGFAETAWCQLLAIDRFADRIRYVLMRMFLPTMEDWNVLHLPDRLYFVYFFIRPLRLAGLLRARSNQPPTR